MLAGVESEGRKWEKNIIENRIRTPPKDNGYMDSVRLERALEQVHPVKIGMLEAKSLLSILSSEMEDMHLGPRVSPRHLPSPQKRRFRGFLSLWAKQKR